MKITILADMFSSKLIFTTKELTLWIKPEVEDDGEVITCKVGIPNLQQATVQNSWNLQVIVS